MNDVFITADQADWERSYPEAITSDPIWKLHAYRTALFLLDLARADIRAGVKRGLYHDIADQLLDSVASISANIGEGYSRATRGDRLRLFGYGLGSLREAVSWYRAAADFLDAGVSNHRFQVIAGLRPLVLGLITSTRRRARREFER
jgi:four helix bundle protein